MNSNLEINLQLLKERWGDRFDYHEFHQWIQGHLLETDFASYELLFQCWNVAYLRGVNRNSV